MRFVAVLAVAALLGALPAAAQTTCRITNTADGKESLVSGDVTGTRLSMLVTENGPFPGKLTLDANSAYRQAPGGAPVLKVFRAGNSVEGKDWRDPGSVETLDGGLLMSWPAFSLDGAEEKKPHGRDIQRVDGDAAGDQPSGGTYRADRDLPAPRRTAGRAREI